MKKKASWSTRLVGIVFGDRAEAVYSEQNKPSRGKKPRFCVCSQLPLSILPFRLSGLISVFLYQTQVRMQNQMAIHDYQLISLTGGWHITFK